MDLKLEVIVVPVSDVDRAKKFYQEALGFRLDVDLDAEAYEKLLGFKPAGGSNFRNVQLTPPGSGCSIHIGKGNTRLQPGSLEGLYLVTDDIEATRAELVRRGVQSLPLCTRVTSRRRKTTKSLAVPSLSLPGHPRTFSFWSRTQGSTPRPAAGGSLTSKTANLATRCSWKAASLATPLSNIATSSLPVTHPKEISLRLEGGRTWQISFWLPARRAASAG
jgi:catechol 2,3-dioxygenase-like lactoylglutathione lyase family enzyme